MAPHGAHMRAVAAEAAHHLTELALEAGDAELAQWAVRQGLLDARGDEILFRDGMLACDLAAS